MNDLRGFICLQYIRAGAYTRDITVSAYRLIGFVTLQINLYLSLGLFWLLLLAGPQSYDACAAYIEEQFEALNDNPEKTVYTHQTCATDTNQVQFVLDSCIDMIIQQNLHGCGLY